MKSDKQRILLKKFQSLSSLNRSHQTLIEYFREFQNNQDWKEWLRFAVSSCNTSVHETIGFTPYTLVFVKSEKEE